MIISPKKAIENGWIKYPDWMDAEFREKCIQPNALDITLDKAFHYPTEFQIGSLTARSRNFELSETHKVMRPQAPSEVNEDGLIEILPGSNDIMSDFRVKIPAGVAAFIIVRSTLNRNGLFITSGLYDQGFDNYVGMIIHNDGPSAYIAPHTRIAQLVFVESEDSGIMYDGVYNQNMGQHWTKISPNNVN